MGRATAKLWCYFVVLFAVGFAGCRDSSHGVTLEGRATYRGEPLANASLTFFPTRGRPASAAVGPDGEYSIELPPGDYEVVVSVGVELPLGFKEGDAIPLPKIVLPAEYTTRAKTMLRVTIAADQVEPIDFELK